jgi:ribose-phosphate pyrophosphokinase
MMGYGVIGNTPDFDSGFLGSSPSSPASLPQQQGKANMLYQDLRILTGNANPELADKIVTNLKMPLSSAKVSRFSDGETNVEIQENIRGCDVFIIQPTCSPANDHLMELLIMADACKRASAGRLTAVLPYYGYARQDRKVASRAPITAKLVADLLSSAGVSRVLTMELHAGQIQGFFDLPVDNLYSNNLMSSRINDYLAGSDQEVVVVSPDAGGVERARAYAKRLGCGLAIIDKRRDGPNVSEVMHLIGNVKDKVAILIDDMIDTAGTLTKASKAVIAHGASKVFAASTHAVLSGPAVERILASPLEKVFVTDTIPLKAEVANLSDQFEVVSVSGVFAEAIKAIHCRESISQLFT